MAMQLVQISFTTRFTHGSQKDSPEFGASNDTISKFADKMQVTKSQWMNQPQTLPNNKKRLIYCDLRKMHFDVRRVTGRFSGKDRISLTFSKENADNTWLTRELSLQSETSGKFRFTFFDHGT
jgi:hypothetical protein